SSCHRAIMVAPKTNLSRREHADVRKNSRCTVIGLLVRLRAVATAADRRRPAAATSGRGSGPCPGSRGGAIGPPGRYPDGEVFKTPGVDGRRSRGGLVVLYRLSGIAPRS